jgi:hypothetical protein
VPSIAVCFLGALLFSLATRDPEGGRILATLVAASIGAFAFLFIAVKTGVPTYVGILVNTGSVSAHRKGDDLGLFRDPLFVKENFGVWPEHFEVSQEGSIAWYINGPPGTKPRSDSTRASTRSARRVGSRRSTGPSCQPTGLASRWPGRS